MDKILIIQDSPSINAMLKARLKAAGFLVEVVETAEKGIAEAKNGGYKLILMDITLPGMDGLQATEILKKDVVTKNAPIILLSAKNEEELIEHVKEVRADGYIIEPFEGKELVEKIKKFIKGSQA